MKSELLVKDVMTTEVTTVEQNESLMRVDQLMEAKRFRHMIVVDEEACLAGVISARDLFLSGLLRALGYGSRSREQVLDSLRVKDAMKTSVHTTAPDMPLREASRIMQDAKVGCLPVLDGDRIVGILTEGDFVRWIAER